MALDKQNQKYICCYLFIYLQCFNLISLKHAANVTLIQIKNTFVTY